MLREARPNGGFHNGKTKKVAPLMGLVSGDKQQEERQRGLIAASFRARFVHLLIYREKKTSLASNYSPSVTFPPPLPTAASLKAPLRLALGTFLNSINPLWENVSAPQEETTTRRAKLALAAQLSAPPPQAVKEKVPPTPIWGRG